MQIPAPYSTRASDASVYLLPVHDACNTEDDKVAPLIRPAWPEYYT